MIMKIANGGYTPLLLMLTPSNCKNGMSYGSLNVVIRRNVRLNSVAISQLLSEIVY